MFTYTQESLGFYENVGIHSARGSFGFFTGFYLEMQIFQVWTGVLCNKNVALHF